MRAILIDPFTETVTETEVSNDYRDIYRAIGADCFCTVQITPTETLFLDDEGLFKVAEGIRCFFIKSYPQMLAGKGLILGVDHQGESVPSKLPVAEVRERVRFIKPSLAPALVPPLAPTIYTMDRDGNVTSASGPWANEEKK